MAELESGEERLLPSLSPADSLDREGSGLLNFRSLYRPLSEGLTAESVGLDNFLFLPLVSLTSLVSSHSSEVFLTSNLLERLTERS